VDDLRPSQPQRPDQQRRPARADILLEESRHLPPSFIRTMASRPPRDDSPSQPFLPHGDLPPRPRLLGPLLLLERCVDVVLEAETCANRRKSPVLLTVEIPSLLGRKFGLNAQQTGLQFVGASTYSFRLVPSRPFVVVVVVVDTSSILRKTRLTRFFHSHRRFPGRDRRGSW
jgi:hypothetical protein